MAGSQAKPGIELRRLSTLAEFHEAVALQQEIWGFADIELLPVRLFVVATKVGGQAIGAFDGARMIAFLLAIPGLKMGAPTYLHSHMMGVLAGYRDCGIGRRLKLAQREEALARGIQLVEWTFDPLELKNAFFNIERLGATVRRYVLNQYGATTSPLHGGLPTDRCVAEWRLASEWAANIIAGTKFERPAAQRRIAVPNEIAEIRARDIARAREIQKGVSDAFLDCFDRGLAVIGFERSGDFGTYLLGPWPSQ